MESIFYLIAVIALLGMGIYHIRMTPAQLEKINDKIQDPGKKKELAKMHQLGKMMVGAGAVFAVLMFI